MTLADISGGLLYVQTEYRDADLIRAVPGARWDKLNRVWTTPLSWGSCLTLRGLFRDRLEIGPELQRWAWEASTPCARCTSARARTSARRWWSARTA
jgi:hypothetical protein